MRHLTGLLVLSGEIIWQYIGDRHWDNDEGVCVQFSLSRFSRRIQQREALSVVRDAIRDNNLAWIQPTARDWTFDLAGLRDTFEQLRDLEWLSGTAQIRPELEHEEPTDNGASVHYDSYLKFYITPEQVLPMPTTISPPPELTASLDRFRKDYPDPLKVGFIMMRFGSTSAHDGITNAIRATLAKHGLTALRADDKQYHDDLFPNVLTYIHGCSFGISVFERLEADDFNPNVSLEVGYMLALQKPVCLLKDRTLRTLHTDLVGKLYKSFEPQDPTNSVPPELEKWLRDKGIIP